MNEFIDQLYKLNLPDNTIRSILLLTYDAKPKEADVIFKNITEIEKATMKTKMKIVPTEFKTPKSINNDCDGCPDVVVAGAPMEKLIIISPVTKNVIKEDIVVSENVTNSSNAVGEILNRFDSDKAKLIEYGRQKNYPVRMNYTVLKLAEIIAANEN